MLSVTSFLPPPLSFCRRCSRRLGQTTSNQDTSFIWKEGSVEPRQEKKKETLEKWPLTKTEDLPQYVQPWRRTQAVPIFLCMKFDYRQNLINNYNILWPPASPRLYATHRSDTWRWNIYRLFLYFSIVLEKT